MVYDTLSLKKSQSIDRIHLQHRSQTTDYDIFFHGSVTLMTPDEAFDPMTGKGKVPGDDLQTVRGCHDG